MSRSSALPQMALQSADDLYDAMRDQILFDAADEDQRPAAEIRAAQRAGRTASSHIGAPRTATERARSGAGYAAALHDVARHTRMLARADRAALVRRHVRAVRTLREEGGLPRTWLDLFAMLYALERKQKGRALKQSEGEELKALAFALWAHTGRCLNRMRRAA